MRVGELSGAWGDACCSGYLRESTQRKQAGCSELMKGRLGAAVAQGCSQPEENLGSKVVPQVEYFTCDPGIALHAGHAELRFPPSTNASLHN